MTIIAHNKISNSPQISSTIQFISNFLNGPSDIFITVLFKPGPNQRPLGSNCFTVTWETTTDGKSEAQELDMKLAAYLLFPLKKKKLPITGPQKATTVKIFICFLPGYIFCVNTHPYTQLQSDCLASSTSKCGKWR